MSSTFTFRFAGDDISDDDVPAAPTQDLSTLSIGKPTAEAFNPNVVAPEKHSLRSLLSTFPSNISYTHELITTSLSVPKRDFHDIHTQLLADSEPNGYAEENVVIEALETGDLDAGYYEGGFKTWECAVDLGRWLIGKGEVGLEMGEGGGEVGGGNRDGDGDSTMFDEGGKAAGHETEEEGDEEELEEYYHIIELGAGTGIPSLALLVAILQRQKQQRTPPSNLNGQTDLSSSQGATGTIQGRIRKTRRRFKFTLCDYNFDVLRLATAPNVLLAVINTLDPSPGSISPPSASELRPDDRNAPQHVKRTHGQIHDVDINEQTIAITLQSLRDHNIEVDFISGAWNDTSFVDLCLRSDENDNISRHTADDQASSNEHYSDAESDLYRKDDDDCYYKCDSGNDRLPGRVWRPRPRRRHTIILASETLYSPTTLPVFAATLKALLHRAQQGANGESGTDTSAIPNSSARAFLSSKQIYFGVGGGVEEFRRLAAASRGLEVEETWSSSGGGGHSGGAGEREGRDDGEEMSGGGGVGRVILRVTPV